MKREPSGVVLYVEDYRVNFLLVEQLLMIWSLVELHHAENGARALEQARTVEPDLVILDLHLPDMKGLEVLRRLRDEPAFARARVGGAVRERSAGRRRGRKGGGRGGVLGEAVGRPSLPAGRAAPARAVTGIE